MFCFDCGAVQIQDSHFYGNIPTGTIIEAYETNVEISDSVFAYNGLINVYSGSNKSIIL